MVPQAHKALLARKVCPVLKAWQAQPVQQARLARLVPQAQRDLKG